MATLGVDEEHAGALEKIDKEFRSQIHPYGRAEVRWDDNDTNKSIGLEKIRPEVKIRSGNEGGESIRSPAREA